APRTRGTLMWHRSAARSGSAPRTRGTLMWRRRRRRWIGLSPPNQGDADVASLVGDARSGSAVRLFLLLLLFLAADAERRHRPGLEALRRDRLLAALAHPEGPVLDPREGLLDLLQQEFLTVSEAKHHRLGVFAGGQVDLVREVVGVEVRLLHESLLGALEKGRLAVLEHLPVALQIFLIQRCDSVTLLAPGWDGLRSTVHPGKKGRGVLSGALVKSR